MASDDERDGDARPSEAIDNTNRRKFDVEKFRAQAAKREIEESELEGLTPHEVKQLKRRKRDPLHQGIIVKRDHLQSRDYKLDLAARLNKTQVISNNTPLNQQAGYYCGVCDCILRDSHSYLDHVNGKYHNRALGMTMRVEKKGLDSVQARLETIRNEKASKKAEEYVPDGFEKRVQDAEEKERQEREEKKARRKEQKRAQAEKTLFEGLDGDGVDPDMEAMLGFKSFGGK